MPVGDTIQVLPYICEGRGGELYTHIVPSTVHHRHHTDRQDTHIERDINQYIFIVHCSVFCRESGPLKTNPADVCKREGEMMMMMTGE